MSLRLRFACHEYDLLEPVVRGEVAPEGAILEAAPQALAELARRS